MHVGCLPPSPHLLDPKLPEVARGGTDPTAGPGADPAQPPLCPGTLCAKLWAEDCQAVQQCLRTPRAAKARGPQTPHWFASRDGGPEGARVAQAPGALPCLVEEEGLLPGASACACVFFLILIV